MLTINKSNPYLINAQIKLWSTISILVFTNTCFAEVYKTVSSDGVAVYTDNINTAYTHNNNSSQINVLDKLTTPSQNILASNQTLTATSVALPLTSDSTPTTNSTSTEDTKSQTSLTTQTVQPSQKGEYVIQLVSPQNEMAYRRATQDIEVVAKLNRPLKTGDRLVYRLNDKTLATTKSLTYRIATTNLDPQPYTITVLVENVVGENIATASSSVYIINNNLIFQQKRKAFEAAQKANANLPWYRKIRLL